MCLYFMDSATAVSYSNAVADTWKDIALDAWTAASIGDVHYLQDIADSRIGIKGYNPNRQYQSDVEVGFGDEMVNFDSKNLGDWTCLMYAAYYDHAQVARWLLEGNLLGETCHTDERPHAF